MVRLSVVESGEIRETHEFVKETERQRISGQIPQGGVPKLLQWLDEESFPDARFSMEIYTETHR